MLFLLPSILALLSSPQAGVPSVAEPLDSIAAWRTQHGSAWKLSIRSDGSSFLHGGRRAVARLAKSDTERLSSANEHLEQAAQLLGFDAATLELVDLQFLPLGLAGSSDKWVARYQQAVAGVPVEGATVQVLLNRAGDLLAMQSSALEREETQALLEGQVRPRNEDGARVLSGVLEPSAILKGEPQLVLADLEGRPLAWRADVLAMEPAGSRRLWVEATTGEVLRSESLVRHFDGEGEVKSFGDLPPQNALLKQPMSRAKILDATTNDVLAVANEAGKFFGVPIPNGFRLVKVQFRRGDDLQVFNDNGPDHEETFVLHDQTFSELVLLADPSQQADEKKVAESIAFLAGARALDFLEGAWPPAEALVDNLAPQDRIHIKANHCTIDGTCTGALAPSIGNPTIRLAANAGQCPPGRGCSLGNGSISVIVAHEMGHWFNVDLLGSGVGSGSFMDEACADVFSMFTNDSSELGIGTAYPGGNPGSPTYQRSGLNDLPFCGDGNTPCYGSKYMDGMPFMGAVWKVREEWGAAVPGGQAAAETLFLAWLTSFATNSLEADVVEEWLVLDDDNGDLSDGTPHLASITAGFAGNCFPYPDLTDNDSHGTGDATIMAGGSADVSDNCLSVLCTGLPASVTQGWFLFGDQLDATGTPVGLGTLYASGNVHLFPVTPVEVFQVGRSHLKIDLGALPPTNPILAGQEYVFQFSYRENGQQNLSNAGHRASLGLITQSTGASPSAVG